MSSKVSRIKYRNITSCNDLVVEEIKQVLCHKDYGGKENLEKMKMLQITIALPVAFTNAFTLFSKRYSSNRNIFLAQILRDYLIDPVRAGEFDKVWSFFLQEEKEELNKQLDSVSCSDYGEE